MSHGRGGASGGHRSPVWLLLGLIPRRDQRELIRADLKEERLRRTEAGRASTSLWLLAAVLESVADWWFESLSWRSTRAHLESASRGEAGGRSGSWIGDVRFALRMIRREKIVSGAVVITVLLGVSSTTAVATLLRGVLLAPLPFPDSGRIVRISRAPPGGEAPFHVVGLPDLEEWRARASTMAEVAGWSRGAATLTGMGDARRVSLARVTPGFERVFAIDALVGRLFGSDDFTPIEPAVILSHSFWEDQFGGEPGVIGRALELDGRSRTIVGVLPDMELGYPSSVDLWLPLAPGPDSWMRTTRGASWLNAVGRVAPGTSIDAAEADLSNIQAALVQEFPREQEGQETVHLDALKDVIVEPARAAIRILVATMAVVLGLASINAGLLLMARSNRRREELAVRTVLGADRRRLWRLILTEALVLALIGGILGVVLALPLIDALIALYPGGLPRAAEVRLEGWVIAVSVVTILAAGAIASLVPVRALGRLDLGSKLRVRGAAGGRGDARARNFLVATQLALCTALVIGAALLSTTLANLRASDPGFEPRGLVSFELSPVVDRYPTQGHLNGFYRRVLENMAAIPGVEAVGAVNFLPFASGEWGGGFDILGETYDALVRISWPGYLETLNRSIVQGRAFDWRDDADGEPVAILSKAAARLAFGDESPLGRSILFQGERRQVVGVVADVRHHSLTDPPQPEIHIPNAQFTRHSSMIVLRAGGDPLSLIPAARRILADIDPNIPLTGVATMGDRLAESVAPQRFRASLLTALGGIATALAVIGVYGMISFSVSQRRREIGVRLALGEPGRSIRARVLRSAGTLSLAGVGAGLLVAWVASRWVESLLFEVNARDPATFAGVALLLLLFGTASAVGPAIRATRVDPLKIIREE